MIVAVSTIHRLDIVISQDESSMKSNNALKAYYFVNKKNSFDTPKFIRLEQLFST